MTAPYTDHYPVMLPEVLEVLSPCDGGVYVDGTFGAGGYTRAVLEAADCRVYAIDRDPSAIEVAQSVSDDFGDRFTFMRGCFGDVETLLAERGVSHVDGFVVDVGVSSMQLDQSDRGFSFRADGPLDMRMDTKSDGETAADIVNTYGEEELANLIYKYGEERKSRHIAKRIVERRAVQKFETTLELADLVRSVVRKSPKDKVDPATRTFQALRIAVNDELGELERALEASESVLADGGRMVVVSFHSLEDRIAKQFFLEKSGNAQNVSRHVPVNAANDVPAPFRIAGRKSIKPSAQEVSENPRSRSARLRYAVRQLHGEG